MMMTYSRSQNLQNKLFALLTMQSVYITFWSRRLSYTCVVHLLTVSLQAEKNKTVFIIFGLFKDIEKLFTGRKIKTKNKDNLCELVKAHSFLLRPNTMKATCLGTAG